MQFEKQVAVECPLKTIIQSKRQMKKFNVYDNFNLSSVNKDVLSRWQEQNLFEQSLKEREGSPSFVFFEGPPAAHRDRKSPRRNSRPPA